LSRFAVPIDPRDGADAAATPAFAGWLVEQIAHGRTTATRGGTCVGHSAGAALASLGGRPAVAVVGGDASNTSVRVGSGANAVIVKLIRRCRSGVQPEVEVGAFLAAQGWTGTSAFRGWLEYRDAAGGSTAIATVHDFLPGRTTAWEFLLGLLTAGGLAGPHRGRIVDIAAALGTTTARMHSALASGDGGTFAPQPAGASERAEAAAALAEHAACVLSQARARAAHGGPLAARLATLAAHEATILARLQSAATVDTGAVTIRIHGDYHLGQVLLDPARPDGDPLVIDFEGEPGRPLEERRRRSAACRDVAGMLRSFDYLLRCAARAGGPPSRTGDRRELTERFLAAYSACASGQPWWPAGDATPALDVFTLDKAVYELAYELANRPDWVEVPLAALEELVGTARRNR
jgi:trehalose synthase-fused probable maltokinase